MNLMFHLRRMPCLMVILLIGLHIQDTDEREGNDTSNHVGSLDSKTNDSETVARKGDESTKSTFPQLSALLKVTSSLLASESSRQVDVAGDKTRIVEPKTESLKERSMRTLGSSPVRSTSSLLYPSSIGSVNIPISTSSGQEVLVESYNGERPTTTLGAGLRTLQSLDSSRETSVSISERRAPLVESIGQSTLKLYSATEHFGTKIGSKVAGSVSTSDVIQSTSVSQYKNKPKETGQHSSFGELSSAKTLALILPSSQMEHAYDTSIGSPTLRHVFQSSSYLSFLSTAGSDARGAHENSTTGFSSPASSEFTDYVEVNYKQSVLTSVATTPSSTVKGLGKHSVTRETYTSSSSQNPLLSIASTHAHYIFNNKSSSAALSVAVLDSTKQVSHSTHLPHVFDTSASLDFITGVILSARTVSSPSESIKPSPTSSFYSFVTLSSEQDTVISSDTSILAFKSRTSHFSVVFTSETTRSPMVDESPGILAQSSYGLVSLASNMTSSAIWTANSSSLNKILAHSASGTLSCGGTAVLYCQTSPEEMISFSPRSSSASMPNGLSNVSFKPFNSLDSSASVSSSQTSRPHLTRNLSDSFSFTQVAHTPGDNIGSSPFSTSLSPIANASTQHVRTSSFDVLKSSILFSSTPLQKGESALLSTHAGFSSKMSVHPWLGSSVKINSFTSPLTPVQDSKEAILVNSTWTTFGQSKTKSPMVSFPLTTSGFVETMKQVITTFSASLPNIRTRVSAEVDKTKVSIHSTASYQIHSNESSTTVNRVSVRPATEPSTTVPTTKARLEYVPSVLLGRTKTTIAVQLDMSSFNFEHALKIDILIQRYGQRTADFEGITALPPLTWFQVHYVVRYSYRRYIAASICISLLHCNRGMKAGFGARSRHRRQLRNGLLVFRAGEEKGCEYRQGQSDYCNGPLEPDTKYRFQILIHYTDSSHISTTPFSKPIVTIASGGGVVAPTEKGTSSSNQTTLIIGIIVVLIIVLMVILGFVILSRKRSARRGPYGHNGELNCALISTFRSHSNCSCTQTGAVEQGFPLRPISKGMSRPVSVKDFHAWVQRSAADSDFRFAEEFESIRDVGRDQPHEASDMPENRGKNRYVNVLAYDHTRVKLSYTDDEAGSDYINANYIHGYKQPRAYIATQGPLPGTTDDFWRMVWEQNSRLIVMITQLTERTRVKCHKYWPGSEPTTYGDITVSLVSDFSFPNWCEREFMLELEGEEPRRIHQYQYNSWPDHGVPKTTSDILEFQSTVQAHWLSSHGPIIVHCSAGVGRTGTFIAIDTIIKRLQEETVVDVYGTVCLMRLQRCSMVQTEDQYIYIHRVVLEYIEQREMNTYIFKGYSLLPLEERDLLESDRGSEEDSLTPTSPLLGENSIDIAFNASPVTVTERETSPL